MKILSLSKIYKNILKESDGEVSDKDIRNVLSKYKDKFKKMNIDITHRLGSGSQGVAYSLSGGNVLKVTQDITEANACAHLIGKNFSNVYKIFDVFQLDSTGFYGIIQEKLKKLDGFNEESLFIERLNEGFEVKIKNGYDLNKFKEEILEYGEEFTQKEIDIALKGFADILEGLKQLKSAGVMFSDVWSENVMKRPTDGNYVIIDVGYSRSAQQPIKQI